jgi:hypothetical protein
MPLFLQYYVSCVTVPPTRRTLQNAAPSRGCGTLLPRCGDGFRDPSGRRARHVHGGPADREAPRSASTDDMCPRPRPREDEARHGVAYCLNRSWTGVCRRCVPGRSTMSTAGGTPALPRDPALRAARCSLPVARFEAVAAGCRHNRVDESSRYDTARRRNTLAGARVQPTGIAGWSRHGRQGAALPRQPALNSDAACHHDPGRSCGAGPAAVRLCPWLPYRWRRFRLWMRAKPRTSDSWSNSSSSRRPPALSPY